MKFAEAVLFRLAGFEVKSSRADQTRFVSGTWRGKTTESGELVFATETGVYTTRTVKRVPDTEQRRADLVKSLQGTPWDRLAGRPAARQLLNHHPRESLCSQSKCATERRCK